MKLSDFIECIKGLIHKKLISLSPMELSKIAPLLKQLEDCVSKVQTSQFRLSMEYLPAGDLIDIDIISAKLNGERFSYAEESEYIVRDSETLIHNFEELISNLESL